MSTVYVGGKMRGLWHLGFHYFDAAATMLRERGFEVVNPAEMDRELGVDEWDPNTYHKSGSWQDCMRRDLRRITTECDAIALLPNWYQSPGARAERRCAETIGLTVYHIDPSLNLLEREVVIGISGYARSGKDTLAAQFVDHHGFERHALADALKDFLYRLDPAVKDEWRVSRPLSSLVDDVGWEASKTIPEVRQLLQRLGTDAGRTVLGDEIWIDTLFGSLHGPRMVVPDVRFPNEAEAIKKRGGYVIRVNRPGVGPANAHVSETALDDWKFDFTVENNREIGELLGPVDRVVNKVLERVAA